MRIIQYALSVMILFLLIGCGGAPVKVVDTATKDLKKKADHTAEKAAEKKGKVKEETETVKEKAEKKAEDIKALLPESLLVKVTLVNSLSLEGIIVNDSSSEIVLKTEVGTVTLKKQRIKNTVPAGLPELF